MAREWCKLEDERFQLKALVRAQGAAVRGLTVACGYLLDTDPDAFFMLGELERELRILAVLEKALANMPPWQLAKHN